MYIGSSWTTSLTNRIRIVAPTAQGQRGGSQRHQGQWSDSAYRLEVDSGRCLDIGVGNVDVEGLQLWCTGDPGNNDVQGIMIGAGDTVTGSITISQTIIRLDRSADERIGIWAYVAGELDLAVLELPALRPG